MTSREVAIQQAIGAHEKGEAPNGPSVLAIRIEGVRVIRGRVPSAVRKELRAGVAAGVLGCMKKDGLLPEVYFHPNSRAVAIDVREREARESISAIRSVCDGSVTIEGL